MSQVRELKLKVAVLGSGGREHALAQGIARSSFCESVVVIPGNAGIAQSIEVQSIETVTIDAMIAALKDRNIDLVVIGPDDYLFQGYADRLRKEGFDVFGPSRMAAQVEWSKAYAKSILAEAQVPTARSVQWQSADQARKELFQCAAQWNGYPLVLKYDGLALGKGVRVVQNEREALEFIKAVFDERVFERGQSKSEPQLICEEFTVGHEVSVFALCDGKDCVVLEPACDHKRLNDGNQGPNTGGMGAYSPVPWLSQSLMGRFKQELFIPTLQVLAKRKTPFQGLLYAGLMIQGEQFSVIEFNARFGDPETQALLPRLESDLLPLLWACARGELSRGLELAPLRWSAQACVNVVAASKGYPEKPAVGFAVTGVSDVCAENTYVFFAGVKRNEFGSLVTAGGRVLSISALGATLGDAREKVYQALECVQFDGLHARQDIGQLYD